MEDDGTKLCCFVHMRAIWCEMENVDKIYTTTYWISRAKISIIIWFEYVCCRYSNLLVLDMVMLKSIEGAATAEMSHKMEQLRT